MKKIQLTILLSVLMSMVGTRVLAYDIAVANDDEVIIYYDYINNGTELMVTCNNFGEKYAGTVNIPKEVTYNSTTYSVTSLGDEAFYDCSGLTSVTIPNSVTSIGDKAFWYCTGLTSVSIGNSVTSIGFEAFFACISLTSFIIPNSVTSIGDEAFHACTNLTSVTFGNSVTSIGDNVFSACPSLTSITVESGNPKYDSRDNCNAIIETESNTLVLGCQNTNIPNSVITIGERAFYHCYGLASVTIPNGVKNIEAYAFKDCPSLVSVSMGSSITKIGTYAFSGCKGITSVTIPNSVTNIGQDAFSHCTGLTSVTIPNSVKSIGWYAFWQCTGLTSVIIPNSVTSIGDYAFSGCTSLTSITSLITEPFSIDNSTFPDNAYASATLKVPEGTIAKYKAADGWKDFTNIVEGELTGILNVNREATANNRYYTLDGREVGHPTKGIYILNGKKVVVK